MPVSAAVPYSKVTEVAAPFALTEPFKMARFDVTYVAGPTVATGSVRVMKLLAPLTVVPPSLVALIR